jgi:transposase
MKLREEKKPMITIPLDLPEVQVLETEVTASGDFVITVESLVGSTRCRKWGRETAEFHSYDRWISGRHLPLLDRAVWIRLRPVCRCTGRPQRYRCPWCWDHPTTTQRLSWYEPGADKTKAYEQYLLVRLINSTIEDVSRKEQVGYAAVGGVVDRYIRQEVDWDEYESLPTLGLDEVALKKGHRDFVVIATVRPACCSACLRRQAGRQPDGRVSVLAVLPNRCKETVQQLWPGIPARVQGTIQTVCTDLDDGFINAVKEELPEATVVADRVHVAKKYRDCADQLRKQEIKRRKKGLPEPEYQEIKGAMGPFRKKPDDLTPAEAARLERLFTRSPALPQAYQLRNQLTAIVDQDLTKAEATEKLTQWQQRVSDSGLTCFDSFLTTLENWMDEITNYFLNRDSSGFVEGLNTKIKVLRRRCYGIFNLGHLFQRLFLDLEGYRLCAKPALEG